MPERQIGRCLRGQAIDMTCEADNVTTMTRRTKTTPLDEALLKAERNGRWLAQQLGVHVSQVSRWQRGANVPTYANQRRIAKALGVSVSSLWPPKDEAS